MSDAPTRSSLVPGTVDDTQTIPALDPSAVVRGDVVPPSESLLQGETFRTVFGSLQGIYAWQCGDLPSQERVQVEMARRVPADCRRLHRRHGTTRLAGWHGGWTSEATGIFAADIWEVSHHRSPRRLGSASVTVRSTLSQGSRTPNGLAC